jgi:competence protein ComGC
VKLAQTLVQWLAVMLVLSVLVLVVAAQVSNAGGRLL